MRRTADPSRHFAIALAAAAVALSGATARADQPGPLRVCADPDSMPFSNARGDGFENKLADLVAGELGQTVAYTWTEASSEALAQGRCDLIVGVPNQFAGVETTAPYYWSSYVLISPTRRNLDISSLKDHRLRPLKIGVASAGGNVLYSPPAQALAEAKLVGNLVGFPIDGGADSVTQRSRFVEAVVRGDIDVAALWGPFAGYFAQRASAPLTVTLIGDTDEFSSRKTHLELLGLQYEIAMGVRPGSEALRRALDRVIVRRQSDIDRLLESYGVPLIKPARLSGVVESPGEKAE